MITKFREGTYKMKPSKREKLEALCKKQKPEVAQYAKYLWSSKGLTYYHAVNLAKKAKR
jgi:hypothetical protein